jgi:predicted mannosyl-3-phosphoglycerate phosphatase (HAD superfamily)
MANGGSNRRQVVLLGILLVLLAVVAVVRLGPMLTGGGGGRSGPSAVADLQSDFQLLASLPQIELERESVAGHYEAARNPFDFGTDPRIAEREALERQRRAAAAAAREEAAREAADRRRTAMQQQEARPRGPVLPRFEYTYIGNAEVRGENDAMIAFFRKREDNRDVQIVKAVGDVIDDEFVVERITKDEVVIGFTNEKFKGQTHSEQIVQSTAQNQRRR